MPDMQRAPNSVIVRLQSRRQARGAVLVEGIIVTSMLMTMMAGGLFLHHLYLAQMKALADARLAAWSQALHGCNSGVDLGGIWRDAGESSAPMDVDTDSAPSFFGAVGHTSGSGSETASAHERAGGKSYTLSVSDSVACNEVAQDERGDVLSLVGYISANIVPSFF
jgi:hypothetical protein